MKYNGMPAAMWVLYKKGFCKALMTDLGYDLKEASDITRKANKKYREIVIKLPEFEKKDRFKANILR